MAFPWFSSWVSANDFGDYPVPEAYGWQLVSLLVGRCRWWWWYPGHVQFQGPVAVDSLEKSPQEPQVFSCGTLMKYLLARQMWHICGWLNHPIVKHLTVTLYLKKLLSYWNIRQFIFRIYTYCFVIQILIILIAFKKVFVLILYIMCIVYPYHLYNYIQYKPTTL